MKFLATLIFFFFSFFAFGQIIIKTFPKTSLEQQSKVWLEKIENPEYVDYTLEKENQKAEFLHFNFSTLLTPRFDFIGYISSEYKRFQIFYTSVSKNESDPEVYKISGITLVDNNTCNFSGTIRIEQVRKYKEIHSGLDSLSKNRHTNIEGVLIGKFQFNEDSNQKYSGKFEGIVTLYWYVDKYGLLHYDDMEFGSDGYINDQYVGKWTEYGKEIGKICNWGEWRIPFSDDLDIGEGEFSPNPKYYDKGWKEYSAR